MLQPVNALPDDDDHEPGGDVGPLGSGTDDGGTATENSTSAARREANRRNAQHSTGPRSEKGKRTSSLNAMKHGIYAQANPIPRGSLAEDPEDVQVFADSLVEELGPRDAQELVVARRIASNSLSLARLDRFESVGLGSAGRLSRSQLEQGIGGEEVYPLLIQALSQAREHLDLVRKRSEHLLASPAWDRVAETLQEQEGIPAGRTEWPDIDEGVAAEEYQARYRDFVLQVLVPRHWKNLDAAVIDLNKRLKHISLQAWEREGQAEEIAVRNAVEPGGILDRTSTVRARIQRAMHRDLEEYARLKRRALPEKSDPQRDAAGSGGAARDEPYG